MRKPRRQAFGGQTGTGIWWRKRSLTDNNNIDNSNNSNDDLAVPVPAQENEEPAVLTATTTTTTSRLISGGTAIISDDEVLIEWDDDLCRPIYRHQKQYDHKKGVVRGHNDNDDDDDSDKRDDGNDKDVANADPNLQKRHNSVGRCISPSVVLVGETHPSELIALDVVSAKIIPQKRTTCKTFANRPQRRPVTSFLNLLQRESSLGKSSSSAVEEREESNLDSNSTRPATTKRKRTNASSRTIHLPTNATNSSASPHHVSLSSEKKAVLSNLSSDMSSSANVGIPDKDVFDFDGKDVTSSDIHQTLSSASSSLIVRKRRSSLQKAQEYFDNLDRTHPLTLDASASPVVSSKITRTTRNSVDLSSPRFKKEYHCYAKALADSGIPPLTMQDYASSRRLHFRKRELYDGFLDGWYSRSLKSEKQL